MMKIPVSAISLFIVVQESVIAKAVVEGSTVRGSYMVYIFVMYQTGFYIYFMYKQTKMIHISYRLLR